jgi:SAM-dependent methyltransferase
MKLLTQQMYSEYEFWNVLLPRWIVPDSQKSVLEVGSAPGGHLVEFHRLFGYRPFGVEYTESGVESNRRTFLKHGFDPDQVIHADFFAAQFQNEYANRFDAVLSRGFIEHFENVEEVIGHHLHVLKPGGFLIVIIPNLQGMHLRAVRRYAPEMLPLHNLVIMNRDRFRQLFQDPSLDHKFCGYQGGVHLLMGSDVPGNRMPEGKRARLRRVQGVLNLMQGAMGSIDSGQTSPYLLYVGQKRLNPTSPIQR